MKTRENTFRRLVLAAMFVALGCVATMVIQIPTVTGYVNIGDGVVMMAGFVLGPVWGFVAGGMGPALADLLSSYTSYVPGTFVIKGLVAVIACLLLRLLTGKDGRPAVWKVAAAAVPAEVFMALGYFAYKATVLGAGLGAAGGIVPDLMQGLVGVILATVLYQLFYRVPVLRQHLWIGA